jgi:chromosome segregation ATPase
MDHKSKLRQIAFGALMALGTVQGIYAQSLPDSGASAAVVSQPGTTAPLPATTQDQQGPSTALTADEAKQSAAGNVAELQQMIRGSELKELRTTYNGSYGASMLFYPQEMTYYVALFQQKTFWRVIKTEDETRAEMIYKDFARQTVQLSDIEIRRTRLEAQKAFTERMIALSQDRANRLQADLTVAHQQQNIVDNQQQQTRAEATALAQQKSAAQAQLRDAQRKVQELQRQLDSGLPTTGTQH